MPLEPATGYIPYFVISIKLICRDPLSALKIIRHFTVHHLEDSMYWNKKLTKVETSQPFDHFLSHFKEQLLFFKENWK